MDRVTPKEALSMLNAVAQVYSEQAKTTKDGARYTDLPGGGSRREFQTAVKGGMRVKWVIDKNGKGSWIPDKPELKPNLQYVGATGAETKRIDPTKDDSGRPLSTNTVPAGSFNISPKGSDRRNEVEAQIKKDNAARKDDQRVEPETAPKPAPKPELTDQQKVRAEYDRLRYSKDPKERAQAAGYGKAMASAGAAKKDFSGYKSAADLAKSNSDKSGTISGVMSNKSASGSGPGGYQTSASAKPTVVTPASSRVTSGAYKPPLDKPTTPTTSPVPPVNQAQRDAASKLDSATLARYNMTPSSQVKSQPVAKPTTSAATPAAAKPAGSIADRIQQIRDMRARSQSRLTSQGGTPATPAVTPSQQSSIKQKVDKVKQPIQSKPQPATNSNQQSSSNNTVQSATGGSNMGARLGIQNAPASAQGMIKDIMSRRNQIRNQAAGRLGLPLTVTTGSGANATTKTYAAGTPKSNPELKSTIDSTRNQIIKGSGIPTGNTIKTKVNPDSSIKVTQKRDPKETAKIKRSLDF